MRIEIKNRFTGSVIFESDVENNSIALTIESALKCNTDLRGADLRGANLNGADLLGANLRDVDLRGADLNGADLRGADLNGANLNGADLNGANLRGANLRDVDLRGANLNDADLNGANLNGANLQDCIGNKKELKTLQVETYSIAFTKDILQIGCKRFTHKEWEGFTDDEIGKMDNGALDWWKKWKDFIFTAIALTRG